MYSSSDIAMKSESGVHLSDSAMPESGLWPERYHMLDGWRGIAALLVVCYHIFGLPGGVEAVMIFFAISGYCIATAASSALRKGLRLRLFIWRRIRRIYPPYLLSLLYFVVTRLIKVQEGRGDQLTQFGAVAWLQNLTLTQWWSLPAHPQTLASHNPINMVPTYWSMGYEEQFYLVVAGLICLSLLSRPLAKGIAALFAIIAIASNWVSPHISYGVFIEYWLHFSVGVLLFLRLCRWSSLFWRRCVDGAFVLIAAFGLYRLYSGLDQGFDRSIGMEWLVVGSFALLLIAARPLDNAFRQMAIGRILSALGLISYSLYLIHDCNYNFAWRLASRLWPFGPHIQQGRFHSINGILQILIHLSLATVFWYCCERPFLNRTLVRDRVRIQPQDPASLAVNA